MRSSREPVSIASMSSQDSSTRYCTREAWVCSASQGHPPGRRSRATVSMSSARPGYGSPGDGSPPCSRCCAIPPAYVVATGSAQQQTATQHTATNEVATNGGRRRPITDAGERATRYDLPPLHAVGSLIHTIQSRPATPAAPPRGGFTTDPTPQRSAEHATPSTRWVHDRPNTTAICRTCHSLHAVGSYARGLRTVVVIPIQGEAQELPDCVIRLSDTSIAQEVFARW